MENYKTIQLNIDIDNMELGSFAVGINNLSSIRPKVKGLLL
jgi:hypothetical protein